MTLSYAYKYAVQLRKNRSSTNFYYNTRVKIQNISLERFTIVGGYRYLSFFNIYFLIIIDGTITFYNFTR